MTADIVNLRRARKAKATANHAATASANRIKFGRTRGERDADRLETSRAADHLEGHRRVGSETSDDDKKR